MDRLNPTNGHFQVGVALACIGVALFEVEVARATPKVYKSPPLVETKRRSPSQQRPVKWSRRVFVIDGIF